MKLLAALAATLAFPAAAHAEATLVTRDVPLRGERSLAAARPPVFHLVGLHWQGPGSVAFRTRSMSGRWSAWRDAQPEPLDVPDAGTEEGRSALAWRLGNPHWVGASDAIRYRVRGRVSHLRAHFVTSPEKAVPVRTLSLAGSPPLIARAAWGANESIRRAGPTYAQSLRFSVVHHTAGSNSYTAAQSAAIVRAIQTYHVKGNGWNDLGYNFLVDKYGQVFEGRYGGVERNVVGAHAEGFNTGSVGVALLGNYGSAKASPQALEAIATLLAWRLDVAHLDPLARLTWTSGGNARFPSGTPTPLAAVSGHRDTGPTACPGNALYAQLPSIARRAAELGLPKLYDPVVTGRVGEPVRVTGRLSSALPWTVRVTDGEGNPVASGSGSGDAVDWTWDAALAPPGRYLWSIDAGPSVRPATGALGQAPSTLTLTGAQARPSTFTPNGDSQADSTVISYSLSLPATVTATLRDGAGLTLATLFSAPRQAGRQSFRFTASGIADGRYTIALVARGSGTESRMEIPVVVDRTLAAFAAKPTVFSPNGDRRLDELALGFVLAAPARVTLRVVNGPTVFDGDLLPGPQSFRLAERLRDGRHAAVLEAVGPFGKRAQTARFVVDTKKPRLRTLSARARRFWVDERVTVTGTIGGLRVQAVVGPGRFRLSGSIGRIRITAWDGAGNRSSVRHP